MNKHKGKKRKALKKQYEKLKNMQRNNLQKGQRYTIDTIADLKKAGFKSRMSRFKKIILKK